jgi:hypothetical protein
MTEPLPVNTKIMAHTAEMLAIPQRICRGNCRRNKACRWHFKKSGEPGCLSRLTQEQRRLFDELYAVVLEIRANGGRMGLMYAWPDPAQRALQDAAVEIARNHIPAYDKRRFDAFRRERAKLPLPVERRPE